LTTQLHESGQDDLEWAMAVLRTRSEKNSARDKNTERQTSVKKKKQQNINDRGDQTITEGGGTQAAGARHVAPVQDNRKRAGKSNAKSVLRRKKFRTARTKFHTKADFSQAKNE